MAADDQQAKRFVRSYYRDHFPEYIDSLPDWITVDGPKEFAIAFSSRYPSEKVETVDRSASDNPWLDFIRRSTQTQRNTTFPNWSSLVEFFANPVSNDPRLSREDSSLAPMCPSDHPAVESEADLPIAEAVYYKLDNHDYFWRLAFDIDAKDVAAEAVDAGSTTTEAVVDSPPSGFEYRFQDVRQAIHYAFDLADWLEGRLNFSDTYIVYSGQGAHVHGVDDNPAHHYTMQSRQFLVEYIKERVGIPIDEQVTTDDARVIRLPFSLHTDVSRIVTPITDRDFDFLREPIPPFHDEQARPREVVLNE